MDRASGSGVFARDPDALLDLIELEVSDDLRKQEENKAVCDACRAFLDVNYPNWDDDLSQDDLCSERAMMDYCHKVLPNLNVTLTNDFVYPARQKIRQRVAPRAGAWIETRTGPNIGNRRTSRPARARGLKLRMAG